MNDEARKPDWSNRLLGLGLLALIVVWSIDDDWLRVVAVVALALVIGFFQEGQRRARRRGRLGGEDA